MAHRRDSTPTSDGLGTKRKRLPACDCCKMRRLKCEPVPPPASCSRCKATGVVCTTTPVVRKKPQPRSGKRIEEAKATFGTADPDAPDFMGASNTPWMPPRQSVAFESFASSTRAPSVSSEARIAGVDLDGAVIAHLLELFQTFPQSWLPIGTRGRIVHLFEAAGRRLEALPPQAEVLACVTIALAARLSSHPALFGPGSSTIPPIDSLTPEVLASQPDLREFGQRREATCEQLRQRAVDLAWRFGTLVNTCEESLASCYLLEMLEGQRDPAAGKPYGSAFVSHLQTILNGQDKPGASLKVMNMSLGWSALIMRETLLAANTGRTSHFTATDDLLLCGDVPPSVEETLLKSVDDVDVRDSVTLFFSPMRPFTYHVARLARECGENISGTAARRQPLNEAFVAKYLTQLDHLLHLFAILESRIAYVLSPEASAAHALPLPFEAERTFIMRACLHTLGLAWAALCLPVYAELARRLAVLRNDQAAVAPRPNVRSSTHNSSSGRGMEADAAAAERRRTIERLTVLRRQVGATALKAARVVAQCVKEAPSLAFLTQLRSEYLEQWVDVLRAARVEEEGGEGITREDKERDLSWLLGGLKTMGWSWTDHGSLIATLEHTLNELAREAGRRASSEHLSPEMYEAHSDVHRPGPPPPPGAAPSGLPGGFVAPPFATGSFGASHPHTPLGHSGPPFATSSQPVTPHPATPHTDAAGAGMNSYFSGPAAGPPLPPPHSTQPQHHPVPSTSTAPYTSLFSSAPTPPTQAQTHAQVLTREQAQSAGLRPSGSSGMPDLFELVSLYATGGLDPLVAQATTPAGTTGLDVTTLAAQYLDGTFDLPSLGATMSPYRASGQHLPHQPDPRDDPQRSHPQQNQQQGYRGGGVAASATTNAANTGSAPDPGEFDLESLLAEPVFAPTPGAQGVGA